MGQAMQTNASSICAFCSRMKRGRIYAAARRKGYNVLALGQHLDDITESFFMSVFHNGRLRTMKACYTNAEGDLKIIRPLIYAREKNLRKFAEGSKLPIIAENCPACFEAPKVCMCPFFEVYMFTLLLGFDQYERRRLGKQNQ